MIVNGAALSEVRKVRNNKGSGGKMQPVPTLVAGEKPIGGSDPVGQTGPATT